MFLHAACVADIPVQGPEGKRGPRAVSADASLSGGRDAVRSGPPPMQQRPQGCVCMLDCVEHIFCLNNLTLFKIIHETDACRPVSYISLYYPHPLFSKIWY